MPPLVIAIVIAGVLIGIVAIVVRLTEGDSTREVTWRQLIDLGSMPRVGDTVRVDVDPAKPSRVRFVGLA